MSQIKSINVYLLRHGKTLGEPALYGHTDVSVAAEHQQDIYQSLMSERLGFDTLITSPLKRCKELAELIYDNAKHLDYVVAHEWREISFGDLDGVPFATVPES